MSDEEHQFESKADTGASKTYPQQAGTIRKNGYIVIKGRPCKVVEASTSKTDKHGHGKRRFVGIDIFTAKKLEDIVPSSPTVMFPMSLVLIISSLTSPRIALQSSYLSFSGKLAD